MSDYLVQPCSPDEAARIIAALGDDPRAWKPKMLTGFVDAWCRNADGSIAWEIHQPNLITDTGRRRFFVAGFGANTQGLFLCTSPSSETPAVSRQTLADDGAATSSQASALQATHAYDSLTLTKSFSATFGAPAANRTIGTIALGNGRLANFGLTLVCAYTLITPVKTQTTSQTLEVLYRITLTPVY